MAPPIPLAAADTSSAARRNERRHLGPKGSFRFGTKAETLERLQPLVERSRILDILYFSVDEWRRSRKNSLRGIMERFPGRRLVIRSSAIGEDRADDSRAGLYTSILDVDGTDAALLAGAVDRVADESSGHPNDQVLVQPMLDGVAMSGVIMTYDVQRGAPYYVLNYDDESGRTDSITGGTGTNKAVLVFRDAEDAFVESPRIRTVLEATAELEGICGDTPLDIEFAVTTAGEVVVLQVRRISLRKYWLSGTARRVSNRLGHVEHFILERSQPRPTLAGSYTILGVMPDWNPAEMIGETPRPLAASLYRDLITRDTWRRSRSRVGYRDMPSEELMVMIDGHPYIDVRNSFNSLLPAGIDEAFAGRLVDAWLDRLNDHPELHDKIEFEVAQTCLDFTFDVDFVARYPGFGRSDGVAEFKELLRGLTGRCLSDGADCTLDLALKNIDHLSTRQRVEHNARSARLTGESATQLLCVAGDLLSECKTLGTLPFAVVARHAFVAEALLRSTVRRGVFDEDRLAVFRRSLRTITSDLASDFASVCRGTSSPDAFLHRYGHLRPGTYDILSLRYDERDDLFDEGMAGGQAMDASRFDLSSAERSGLNSLLLEANLGVDADRLMTYAAQAISGREFAKFVFTRNVSDALLALVRWGECLGLSRGDLSHIEVTSMLEGLSVPVLDDIDLHFLDLAERGRRSVASAQTLKLSYLIRDAHDIYVIPLHRSAPNFVGAAKIEAPSILLDPMSPVSSVVFDRIVCMENADPGYDWIFAKGVAGVVTKFGGANSHMAIRCAEFGTPAAIGCGEQTFERIVGAGRIELNCAERVLRPVYGR